ncbi:hypothetical protein [Mycoplasma suis]|uniref:Uncharacterized protein n=1 Tax=Mycoplasma suis (strain Illinois) TaxID=768700 RepID=F0QRX2_MYCSL|nr:hypothetical protein [Mycoplasma suis]ADX98242.1 hypothetical protein MSU_0711 [Mycoplasma suis str. Illinois]
MKKVGFYFLRQSVMVWYEKDGTITSGWKDNNGSHDSQNSGARKFMEVINCYQV